MSSVSTAPAGGHGATLHTGTTAVAWRTASIHAMGAEGCSTNSNPLRFMAKTVGTLDRRASL